MNTTTTPEEKAIIRASKLGAKAGENAAEWAIQDLWGGRANLHERESAESVLRQLDDGDPAIYDAFKLPNLSGEWADEMNGNDLFWSCMGYEYFPDADGNMELMDELCTTWEQAVSDSFFATLEQSARDFLAE